jgi:predicted  nucleic acid-binding Zn-ribbon protein
VEQLTSLADLLDLHDVDLQIDRLLEERGSLAELTLYKDVHEEVQRLEAALTEARSQLKAAELGLDRTNGELEIAANKAASEQNRLYAGGISARDADYLRREVDMLYARVKNLEDGVIEYMEAREAAEGTVDDLEVSLAEHVAEKERLGAVIRDRWRLIDKELAVKEGRKAAAAELVDEYLMELYDDLRGRRTGRVVARLTDATCGACHLRLSAAEAAKVVRDDPPRCIHCQAILVI